MAPKHFHRLVQRRLGVEFAGASHAHVPVSSEFTFCRKLNAKSYLFVLAILFYWLPILAVSGYNFLSERYISILRCDI
jgi:hypothetical protein